MSTERLMKKNNARFYRGKNIEELKTFNIREFAKIVKSRTRRSLLRNYDTVEAFVRKFKEKDVKNKMVKTHNRALVVVPQMVGRNIGIHNGKEFIKVLIVEEMLGHRLGEFSPTRKIVKHTKAGIGATKSTTSKAK